MIFSVYEPTELFLILGGIWSISCVLQDTHMVRGWCVIVPLVSTDRAISLIAFT